MARPKLKEGFTEWEIEINPDLKFARAETWKKGIKRYWGFDPVGGRFKLMFVQYPKSKFSREDMNRILPKYSSCPNCTLGKKFINSENNNKNMSMDLRNFSVVDLFGKIPAIGDKITQNRDISEGLIMQLLATISRYPISILTTDLGKRITSFIVGLIGIPATLKLAKGANVQSEWLEYFTNMISSSAEMNGRDGSFGVEQDIAKLRRAITSGNFYGVSDALLKNNTQVKNAIDSLVSNMNFGNVGGAINDFGNKVKDFFGKAFGINRLRTTEGTISSLPKRSYQPKTPQLSVKEANDYRYIGTEDRFRDISKFGAGFRSQRRLRESGDLLY